MISAVTLSVPGKITPICIGTILDKVLLHTTLSHIGGDFRVGVKHILIIEDDKDILEVLKDLLESEGYQVSLAENGQEALDLLDRSTDLPGLILVDLMMPIMDGFQFRQRQSADERFKNIPVVVMSADGYLEAKKKRIGVETLMKKPLDLENFLSIISEQYVELH